MERELVWAGIGGQGVQLASKVLAHAANDEGKHAMHFAVFKGSMRGGSCECTVVSGTRELNVPPIVQRTWSAIAMHPAQFADLQQRVKANGLFVVNDSVVSEPVTREDITAYRIPLSGIAEEMDFLLGVSMVALGAYLELTQFASRDAVVHALQELIPAYRQKHIDSNLKAIDKGMAYVKEHPARERALALAWR